MTINHSGHILLKYIEIDINYSNKSRVMDTYLDTKGDLQEQDNKGIVDISSYNY